MVSRIALLVSACTLYAQQGPAQQDPTIRLDVQQVLVPVIVADGKGHHVTGLHASDFQVYEDGVRQEIAALSTDLSASVDNIGALSKAAPQVNPGPRRTYVICVDTLHTAPASVAKIRDALENVLAKEKTSDAQYVLIGIGSHLQVLQAATTNPVALLAKIRSVAFQSAMGGLDSSALAAESRNLRSRLDDFCRHCPCGTRPARHSCDAETETLKQNVDTMAERWVAPTAGMLAQFGSVVQELAKIPTARTLILVSDGFATDPKREFYDVISTYLPNSPLFRVENSREIDPGLREALKVAAERNVTIDAIDSRGGSTPSLATTGPMDAGGSVGSAGGLGDMKSADTLTRTSTLHSAPDIQSSPFASQDSAGMVRLAHSTGGIYFHGGNDLLKEFRSSLADGREYYLLAYVPKNKAQDGKFRAITVEINDKKLNVRAKAGYWSAAQ